MEREKGEKQMWEPEYQGLMMFQVLKVQKTWGMHGKKAYLFSSKLILVLKFEQISWKVLIVMSGGTTSGMSLGFSQPPNKAVSFNFGGERGCVIEKMKYIPADKQRKWGMDLLAAKPWCSLLTKAAKKEK